MMQSQPNGAWQKVFESHHHYQSIQERSEVDIRNHSS
jgi:hypothetical protein